MSGWSFQKVPLCRHHMKTLFGDFFGETDRIKKETSLDTKVGSPAKKSPPPRKTMMMMQARVRPISTPKKDHDDDGCVARAHARDGGA